MLKNKWIFLLIFFLLFHQKTLSAENQSLQQIYRIPPKELAALADVPLTPVLELSSDREWMLLLTPSGLDEISDLAQPELRLAGLRINPRNNGPSREQYYNKFTLRKTSDGSERKITGLPEKVHLNNIAWSPDSNHIAFTINSDNDVELWVIDVRSAQAGRLTQIRLNSAWGEPFFWLSDNRSLLCKSVPSDRGPEPDSTLVPAGPIIQENSGKKTPARTYEDLLKNPHDEAMFEYYLKSRLILVNLDGKTTPLGSSGIIHRAKPSPDGKYILVETIKHPFSYLVPVDRFPKLIEVWDSAGKIIKEVARLPLAEEIPISFDAVPEGPRSIDWRADTPATLYWAEALDKGDPKVESEVRDRMYMLSAPFNGKPVPLISLATRFNDIKWCDDNLALIREDWQKTRLMNVWIVKPASPANGPEKLFSYSKEDRYNDPGKPMLKKTSYGTSVMFNSDNNIYLSGDGASPDGDRPFLDKFDLTTGKSNRLWQSQAPYYERPANLIDENKLVFLTRRESVDEPPNYFLHDLLSNGLLQLTYFPHPTPELANIKKELIRYKRDDGVELTATLYLPPGYSPDKGPLPMVMWAYPREFKSSDAAGQVTTSPYRFIRIYWASPLVWLTQGYAVLDNPSMPIIGEKDKEPNDTYVKQLVSSAKAAVEEVVRRGVADPDRIAIGGHSYGAFMTANLLVHTDLFRAGIACSGAYNRTLTPFGFQGEERTFWEAPEVYFEMSPFMHADNLKEPLLLIHGEADDNPGTYPIQSERFYEALKGLGATVRLVILPCEAHTYRSRESVLHELWEINEWLEKYVKHAEPRDHSK